MVTLYFRSGNFFWVLFYFHYKLKFTAKLFVVSLEYWDFACIKLITHNKLPKSFNSGLNLDFSTFQMNDN